MVFVPDSSAGKYSIESEAAYVRGMEGKSRPQKKQFLIMIVTTWNSLPSSVVKYHALNTFRIDEHFDRIQPLLHCGYERVDSVFVYICKALFIYFQIYVFFR